MVVQVCKLVRRCVSFSVCVCVCFCACVPERVCAEKQVKQRYTQINKPVCGEWTAPKAQTISASPCHWCVVRGRRRWPLFSDRWRDSCRWGCCVRVCVWGRERASEREKVKWGEERERESVSWNTVITSNSGVVATARHSPGSQNILWNQVSDPRHILGTEETGCERTTILPGYKR